MGSESQAVKRRYDSSRRQERARRSRDRILDEAEEAFLSTGYGATSIGAIAAAAGVSVDTIYKSYGGKPGLIRALRTRALRGQEPLPAETRSDRIQQFESDPHRIIEAWGQFLAELAPRGGRIQLLVRDAIGTHPELRGLLQEMDDARLRRMTENARRLHKAGHLRRDVGVADAALILWTYSSPEVYELLVLRRGLSLADYASFVSEAMAAALL